MVNARANCVYATILYVFFGREMGRKENDEVIECVCTQSPITATERDRERQQDPSRRTKRQGRSWVVWRWSWVQCDDVPFFFPSLLLVSVHIFITTLPACLPRYVCVCFSIRVCHVMCVGRLACFELMRFGKLCSTIKSLSEFAPYARLANVLYVCICQSKTDREREQKRRE